MRKDKREEYERAHRREVESIAGRVEATKETKDEGPQDSYRLLVRLR